MDLLKLAAQLQGRTQPKPSSGNQRAYADMLEELACGLACAEFPDKFIKARSVRSPEDFTLFDSLSNHVHLIDVKTRQLNTQFNMPNLISVDRLDKILSNPNETLHYWLIDYEVLANGDCVVQHSEIRSICTFPWSALAIQNLGKGQVQIKNWTALNEQYVGDQQSWLYDLRIMRKMFYLKQAKKFQAMADKIQA